ncbi:MAG: hypothetical protein JRI61_07250 [Deltaproteobacteria bacterium]|nr:hypothetical protein [Deltaproteobacteria bacterium]
MKNGMDIFSGDFYTLVFKESIKVDIEELSLDSHMLKILMALDGKKNLASVSRSLNIGPEALKEALIRLYNIQLIEKVKNAVPTLSKDFYDFLTFQLSLALGPLAEFLIEDEIREFNDDPEKIPFSRAAELVNLLARQIPREEKKIVFQQAMVQKIKETKP